MDWFKNRLFPLFLAVVFITTVWVPLNKYKSRNFEYVMIFDAEGYYLYLPALFINNGFENLYVETKDYLNEPYYRPYPNTNKVFTKYTYGVALMEAPFFLIAHALAKTFPQIWQADGYSSVYIMMIFISGAVYLCLGFFFLYKLLKLRFPLFVILFTFLGLWLGTSMIYYSSVQLGYSHPISFFLISLFIYLSPRWLQNKSWKLDLLFASILAIITLIRPTNIVIILYPLLYNVLNKKAFLNRIKWMFNNVQKFTWFPICLFLIYLPQFAYWKYLSGNWLLYSYTNEGFIYWKKPKMYATLFDPQNGFFVYAPFMLFLFPGLWLCAKKKEINWIAIVVVLFITDYICGSWWCWWFGGAFGYRPFIDYFSLLAFPLVLVFTQIAQWKLKFSIPTFFIASFLIFFGLRLMMIYQYPWQGNGWIWADVFPLYQKALFLLPSQ